MVYTVNDGSLIFFTTSAFGSHPKQADLCMEKESRRITEGTEKVGTFQHFLSRGKNQELAKSKTVDLASFHFVRSISSRYRNLGRIRAQWQYSRYNKESPFSSNAVSA